MIWGYHHFRKPSNGTSKIMCFLSSMAASWALFEGQVTTKTSYQVAVILHHLGGIKTTTIKGCLTNGLLPPKKRIISEFYPPDVGRGFLHPKGWRQRAKSYEVPVTWVLPIASPSRSWRRQCSGTQSPRTTVHWDIPRSSWGNWR